MKVKHGNDLTPKEFKALVKAIEISLQAIVNSAVKEKNVCLVCMSALLMDVADDLHNEYQETAILEKGTKDVRH